jgi:hypothetical protein
MTEEHGPSVKNDKQYERLREVGEVGVLGPGRPCRLVDDDGCLCAA